MTTYTTDTINHILSTSLLTAKYTQEDADLINQADILLQDRLNQARNAPGTEYHTPEWFAAEFNAVATNSVWDPQRALDLVMMFISETNSLYMRILQPLAYMTAYQIVTRQVAR